MSTASPLQELRRARDELGSSLAGGHGAVLPERYTPSPPRRLVRHSSSASQPSSLAPFVASLDLPRKGSLQQDATYPMLAARSDVVPSQLSSQQQGHLPPLPSLPRKQSLKSKPPPINVAAGNAFFTPLIKLVNKGDEEKVVKEKLPKMMKLRKNKEEDRRIENQQLFQARFPPADDEPPLAITMANGREVEPAYNGRSRSESAGSIFNRVERKPVPAVPTTMDEQEFDLMVNSDAPTRRLVLPPPSSLSSRSNPHRRASSFDESPKLLSSATFQGLRERPATSYEPPEPASHPDSSLMTSQSSNGWSPEDFPEPRVPPPRTRSRSRSRPHLHPTSHSPPPGPSARSASSPAIIAPHLHFEYPKSPPARSSFSHSRSASGQSLTSKNADAFFEPTTPTASTHRKQRSQGSAPPPTSSGASTVGIAVRDYTGSREVARAKIGDGGVAVTLSSAHRPEDLEVGWNCIPGVDEDGRPFTQWEIKIRPRVATFSGYQLGTIPNPPLPNNFNSPTSPRSNSRQQEQAVREDWLEEPHQAHTRKFSGGSSFSSESSGPLTPRRGKFSGAGAYNSSDAELDPVSIAHPSSPSRRIGRAPSYASVAEQYRQRQSMDDDGSRNSSLTGGDDKRSPRNRFGYIAPVGDVDILNITNPTETLLDNVALSSPSGSSDAHFRPVPTLSPSHRSSRQRTKSDQALEALSAADLPSDHSEEARDEEAEEEDDDTFGPSRADMERAKARGLARAVSRWSDTDCEGEEEEDGPQTSWSDVPDAEE